MEATVARKMWCFLVHVNIFFCLRPFRRSRRGGGGGGKLKLERAAGVDEHVINQVVCLFIHKVHGNGYGEINVSTTLTSQLDIYNFNSETQPFWSIYLRK